MTVDVGDPVGGHRFRPPAGRGRRRSPAARGSASAPPAWAMSGRPPPPLPPSASAATRTRSTAEKRAGQVVGDAGRHRRLVAGVGDEQHDAGLQPRLVLVDQAAQVLARDAGQRLGEEGHAVDRLRARFASAGPPAMRQPAAQVGDLLAPAPCARRAARGCARPAPRAGRAAGRRPRRAPASAAATCASAAGAGQRLDPAHAAGRGALGDELERADVAGARDVGAAAELERIGLAARRRGRCPGAAPIETTRTSSPYFSPNSARAPSFSAASGVMIRVSTGVFCRT